MDAWEHVSRFLTARECVKYLRPLCNSLRGLCDAFVDVLEIRHVILIWKPDRSTTRATGVLVKFAFYKPTAGRDDRRFSAGDYVWSFSKEPFPLTTVDLWEMKFGIHLRCDAKSDDQAQLLSQFCLTPVHAVAPDGKTGTVLMMTWPYFGSFDVVWQTCGITDEKTDSVRLEISRAKSSEQK